MNHVRVWEEICTIPTYKACAPEKSPLFLERRAYQGSTGKVYPLPVTERISDSCEDVAYRAVYLENAYLRLMILPELGGRIHRAYDKTNGYDFVYYNHVIKPALVGLTGPWISGGIEFNWPQHHRPSTFSPVDWAYTENEDGSCTVHVGETDKMYGTKGMASITLYPGKAYIEIRGQLYNPTDLPQTFLWWANPAVPANAHSYSVFPPDVHAVFDHGKRGVSTFPIATGEYYKADYSAGVDISRYKNVPVPTSYMAAHSDYDFIGSYDEERAAGLLHVADHHVSPGKKQWTWGNGDFGRSWDRNLTETDGPYIELMTGVFTDNQPDFTWLKPYEEKTFVQYFMPYKGVGRVGNATKEAMVSLNRRDAHTAEMAAYATGEYRGALLRVTAGGRTIFTTTADLSPAAHFSAVFPYEGPLEDCKLSVLHEDRPLVEYTVYKKRLQPVPEAAEGMKPPREIKSLEELYLCATHLEQYRHAFFAPEDYYLEGLRRDGTDIRLNNGYGRLLLRRGRIRDSIRHFQAAVDKQTWKNPNPYAGECYFNLGLALNADGQREKAYDAFYKSTWSGETQSAGFYWLACLSAQKKEYRQALEFAEQSLVRNWHHMKARNLKLALLRQLGEAVSTLLEESLAIDPLHMGCLYEKAMLTGDQGAWEAMMRTEAHNYLVLSSAYLDAGLYPDAMRILSCCREEHPMLAYYKSFLSAALGDREEAAKWAERGEAAPPEGCFPSRMEEMAILLHGIRLRGGDAPMARYYLGNLLYDKKQYADAVMHWETAAAQNPAFAMVHRNLSIAYFNKAQNPEKAYQSMRRAFDLEKTPRFLLELDQLEAKRNTDCPVRLAQLKANMPLVTQRDDLYLRYISLLNHTGEWGTALGALKARVFHPWEGGEGKVSRQYRFALRQLAKEALRKGDIQQAISMLTDSLHYPENLGEGKLPNTPDHETYYGLAMAYAQMGDEPKAKAYFGLAAQGEMRPGAVLYYNDQPSDYIYFQGLAHRKLGHEALAKKAFHTLISFGEKHIFDAPQYDFFAVSLPEIEVYQEDIRQKNRLYCKYLRALGHLGLGEEEKKNELMQSILAEQRDYQSAVIDW